MHQRETLHEKIHVRGCIHAVNLWMSDNIGITVALCCAIGLPQVIGNVLRLECVRDAPPQPEPELRASHFLCFMKNLMELRQDRCYT